MPRLSIGEGGRKAPRTDPWAWKRVPSDLGGQPAPQLFVVGEAPGTEEARAGRPFVGKSGQALRRMLGQAGIDPGRVAYGNVLGVHPPRNDLREMCLPRKALPKGYPALGKLGDSGFLRPEWLGEVGRLWGELGRVKPNLVVGLGNVALWGLSGGWGITKVRGGVMEVEGPRGEWKGKFLPSVHPAACLRNGQLFPLLASDLRKAAREMGRPEVVRPSRRVLIRPTVEEVEGILGGWQRSPPGGPIAVDIETKGQGQLVTCIGFAPSRDRALVVPLVDQDREDWEYWAGEGEMRRVFAAVQRFLADPGVPKVFHNGAYDTVVLGVALGMAVRGWSDDTLLLWHSIQMELPKGLGVLGSLFTDEASWKTMVRKRAEDETKRDE